MRRAAVQRCGTFFADPDHGDIVGSIDNISTDNTFTGNISVTASAGVGRVDGLGNRSHIHTNRGNISVSAGRESVGDYPNTVVMWGGGNIWGDITTDSGDITSITTPHSIHANLTASSGNIAPFSAGGDISGAITDHDGTIGRIVALSGSISGSIVSDGSIGSAGYGIEARNDITATITAGDSGGMTTYLIQAGRDFGGSYTGGQLQTLKVGRDMTAAVTVGGLMLVSYSPYVAPASLNSVSIGRDSIGSLTVAGDIGAVLVGRAITGNIISTNGGIASVTAGATTADQGLWADPHTVDGSIGPGAYGSEVIIRAKGDIGKIAVKAAPGGNGAIAWAVIDSTGGNIAGVSAVNGILAEITAQGSFTGDITTSNGDIDGGIEAKNGDIPLVAADNGSITASLTAGGAIGPILANRNITGVISAHGNIGTGTASYNSATITGIIARGGKIVGDIKSDTGSIGNITAGADILGNIWAMNNIGNITAGLISTGNIGDPEAVKPEAVKTGKIKKITAKTGSIGSITAAGSIIDDVEAASSIGSILALGNISGAIKSNASSIASVTAWGGITNDITAHTTVGPIDAITIVNSNITAGVGDVSVACFGKVTGRINVPGKKSIIARGNVIESIDDGHAAATVLEGAVPAAKSGQDLPKVDWNNVPLKRVDDLVEDRLAMRSDNGQYVMVATAIGNKMVRLYFEKTREVRAPTTVEFAQLVEAQDANLANIPPDMSIPTGREVYKLVASVVSQRTYTDATSLQEAINRALTNRVLINMLADNDKMEAKVGAANTDVALLTFAVHVLPTGGAIDNYSQGNNVEAAIDITADAAMFLTFGVSKVAGVSKAAATAIRASAITLELGVASARTIQGINAIRNKDTGEAAGYFGDALLRLLGVGVAVNQEVKLLRSAVSVRPTAGGLFSEGTVFRPVENGFARVPFSRSFAESGGINYGALDSIGRPTGVYATITQDMLGTGTPANGNIIPPGWSGNGTLFNEARGHLFADMLGGSGNVAENLVTMQNLPANSPVMRGFEYQVRAAVQGGQVVRYSSVPIYNDTNLVPQGITLTAEGSNGFRLNVTVLNPVGR
jgi:hypothetical protein